MLVDWLELCMTSDLQLPADSPASCGTIIEVAEAERTTLVDAVYSGEIRRADLTTFLQYTRRDDVDFTVDRGLVKMVSIITTLLEVHDI